MHFKLEQTLCQQSLIYIYLCIIWKVHSFLVKKDKCFCVIKTCNIILTITHCWSSKNRNERQRHNYTRGGPGAWSPGKILNLHAHLAHSQRELTKK